MPQVFYNNTAGSLSGAHNNTTTSLILLAGHNFVSPGANYYLATLILLDSSARETAWEIVRVTAVSGNTLTVVRAQEGTTARSWASNSRIELRLTAGATESKANLGTAAYTASTAYEPVDATLVRTTATQTLTNKTLSGPVVTGAIKTVGYLITDAPAFEIAPANGALQYITLAANRTPKGTNFQAGHSVLLQYFGAYDLDWSDATFGSGGVTWIGDIAPVRTTGKWTAVQLWKIGTTVFGAAVPTLQSIPVITQSELTVALDDADNWLVYSAASAKNRRGTLSQLWTYITTKLGVSLTVSEAGALNLPQTGSTMSIAGTQVVLARRTGWGAPTGTATRTTFATSTVTTAQLAERVKALIDDLRTHGLIGN